PDCARKGAVGSDRERSRSVAALGPGVHSPVEFASLERTGSLHRVLTCERRLPVTSRTYRMVLGDHHTRLRKALAEPAVARTLVCERGHLPVLHTSPDGDRGAGVLRDTVAGRCVREVRLSQPVVTGGN